MNNNDYEIKQFTQVNREEVIAVISAYLAGWPYVRMPDDALFDYWKTLPAFQPENLLLASDGAAGAFLHGEIAEEESYIHLLAVPPGSTAMAIELLAIFEERARSAGSKLIIGPRWASAIFYGGYILGNEPFHPHWAIHATDAYVRAGFRVSHEGVLLRTKAEKVQIDPIPEGYELTQVEPQYEFDAHAFGYHMLHNGQKAAHCYARWYPHLFSPNGGTVGQIGNVTTEEPHRSKGLARTMVQRSLQRMKQAGVGEVLITTGLANIPALRCYERVGFKRYTYMMEWSKTL